MDREAGLPFRAWLHPPMAQLRSHLKGSKLRIETNEPKPFTDKGLPVFIELDLDEEPEKAGGNYIDFQRSDNGSSKSFEGY